MAQITEANLRQWRKRGLLFVHKADPTSWTRYSTLDALKVAVVAELSRYGLDLRFAASMAETLDFLAEADSPERLERELFIHARLGGMHMKGALWSAGGLHVLTSESVQLNAQDEFDTVLITVDVAKIYRRLSPLHGEP